MVKRNQLQDSDITAKAKMLSQEKNVKCNAIFYFPLGQKNFRIQIYTPVVKKSHNGSAFIVPVRLFIVGRDEVSAIPTSVFA